MTKDKAMITYQDVQNNEEFNAYIQKGNELLGVLGYTDHSAAHTMKVAMTAGKILEKLGYDQRTVELAKITGYIHDIGNMVNRIDHAQTGALLAFNILTRMGMPPDELAAVVGAIGNHDESTGLPVSGMSAAIIIADKTDVRRSRVRNRDFATFDIHDRVNYAVEESVLTIRPEERMIQLDLTIDHEICSVLDYFEIFLGRMILCKRSAEYLQVGFKIMANGAKLL